MKPQKICSSNDRIRELLRDAGITQTEFCKRTKINKSALSNYLNEERTPRQDQLSKIADAFDVSAAWLMGYDVPKRIEHELLHYCMIDPDNQFMTYHAPPERLELYVEILSLASSCTREQLLVVIETLRSLSKLNKKED